MKTYGGMEETAAKYGHSNPEISLSARYSLKEQ
jgi:hypothetical protein